MPAIAQERVVPLWLLPLAEMTEADLTPLGPSSGSAPLAATMDANHRLEPLLDRISDCLHPYSALVESRTRSGCACALSWRPTLAAATRAMAAVELQHAADERRKFSWNFG